MVTTKQIIKDLGGATGVSRSLGISRVSVHKWMARNRIPPGQVVDLLALSRAAGLPYAAEDFLNQTKGEGDEE